MAAAVVDRRRPMTAAIRPVAGWIRQSAAGGGTSGVFPVTKFDRGNKMGAGGEQSRCGSTSQPSPPSLKDQCPVKRACWIIQPMLGS